MQKLTAQFIESFYILQQEELLLTNFIEEVAMIEQLSLMALTQDDEHYLDSFINKDIPKIQSILNKTYSNEILAKSHLDKNETVEENLVKQIKVVKNNFKTFFIQVFDDEKFKILANANLLNQKSNNFKSTNGAATTPSLKTKEEEENFFKPIVMPTAKKLEDIGTKILEDNVGNWENKFKRKSQQSIESNISEPINQSINNTVYSITKNINEIKIKKEISPAIFIAIITLVLSILYIIA